MSSEKITDYLIKKYLQASPFAGLKIVIVD
jgi:hypothetical protein